MASRIRASQVAGHLGRELDMQDGGQVGAAGEAQLGPDLGRVAPRARHQSSTSAATWPGGRVIPAASSAENSPQR